MRKIISRSVILYEKVDFLCDKKSKNIIYSNWNVINLCVQDASALNRASFYSDFLRADTCAWYDTPSLPSIETQPHASLLHWEEPPIMPSMEPRPGVQPQKLASILQKNKMIKNLKNNFSFIFIYVFNHLIQKTFENVSSSSRMWSFLLCLLVSKKHLLR